VNGPAVAAVDCGTNSTRLLVARRGEGGELETIERLMTITRLGAGVGASGRLDPAAVERTVDVLGRYREVMDVHGVTAVRATATSAARDAANRDVLFGPAAVALGAPLELLDGAEEGRLTFRGATAGLDAVDGPFLVVDIGGGSTEFVVGRHGAVDFHTSTQAGVVRQSERHLTTDPPDGAELDRLAADARAVYSAALPDALRATVGAAVAVAGTATSCAAIAQELEPYDPRRVHGFVLEVPVLAALAARLAAMPEAERRTVAGLHPDRAPTIVAGVVLLIEALTAFGLDRCEVSEHDILRGVALRRAGVA